MTIGKLIAVNHRYFQCLNERRWNDLDEFVGGESSFNEIT